MRKLITVTAILILTFVTNSRVRSQWVYTNGPNLEGSPGIVECFGEIDSALFVGTENNQEFSGTSLTTDYGTTWQESDNGMKYLPSFSITGNETYIFAGTLTGLYRSSNRGASWIQTGPTTEVWSLASNGTNVFAGTIDQGVFLSTDTGRNWDVVDSGFNITYAVTSFAISGNNLFAGTDGNGILLSTNNGTSWVTVNSGLTDLNILCLTLNNAKIFAGTKNGIFISTNMGTSWTTVDSGLTDTWVPAIASNGVYLFAGTSNGIFLSVNNGLTWSADNDGLTNYEVNALAVDGPYLFAGSAEGVWRRPLSDFGISSVSQTPPATSSEIQIYPNPVSQSTQINFTSQAAGYADVSIVNMLGVEAARVFSGEMGAGNHSFSWSNTTGLQDGIYECLVRMNGQVQTLPVALMR